MSDNVDDRRAELWRREQEIRGRIDQDLPIGGEKGGPHMPGMEKLTAEVDALKNRFDAFDRRVDAKFDAIDTRLRGVEGDVREIKATLPTIVDQLRTLNSKLPTVWQVTASASVLIAIMIGLVTLASKIGAFAP